MALTKRILFTLGDIKELLAKKYHIKNKDIEIYNCDEILLRDCVGDIEIGITNKHYLFQIDIQK